MPTQKWYALTFIAEAESEEEAKELASEISTTEDHGPLMLQEVQEVSDSKIERNAKEYFEGRRRS